MRFVWDWPRPLVTVPYVPTLGPVHPDGLTPALFADVLAVSGTGRFLPYDKDRRWFDAKDERVLPEVIVHRPGLTLVPTHSTRRAGAVKVHLYGPADAHPVAAELARKLAADHVAGRASVVAFQVPGAATTVVDGASTRVQLREFTAPRPGDRLGPVRSLAEQAAVVRGTFAEFAEKLSGEGFAFLRSRI